MTAYNRLGQKLFSLPLYPYQLWDPPSTYPMGITGKVAAALG